MSSPAAEGEITIALAANSTFSRQLAVVIAGISRSASNVPHRVFVLHDGYDEALMARVGKSASSGVNLCWIDATSATLNAAQLPAYLPTATLFRLRIEELLPPTVERLIYLDTDIAVRESLSGLWAHDLGDTLLAAVRDPVVPWAASPLALDWPKFELAPDMPYFNCGVLLIPLARWRAEGVARRALELLTVHRLEHADQCALNIIAAGNWTALAPRWNVQAGHLSGSGSLAWITEPREALENARRNPAIIHYNHAEWKRPWQPRSTHPHRDEWFEDLDRTAWAGWRPRSSETLGRLKLAATHLQRAARALSGHS
jgi:lipopolysaccharide biosynthesis glycosyltransferase